MATCLHPKFVKGKIFPCGKCPICRQNMRQAKGERFLLASAFNSGSNYFITLTYDDDNINYCLEPNKHGGDWFPCFNKLDIKLFFQNLRNLGYRFKYFVTSEYGDNTHRPHYHALLLLSEKVALDKFLLDLQQAWTRKKCPIGFVTCAPVSDSRVQYCAKYCLKDSYYYNSLPGAFNARDIKRFDFRKPFQLISNHFLGDKGIEFLNEYIYNDGDIREFFTLGKNTVHYDQYIKNHIDPSLKAELDYLRLKRQDELNIKLMTSKFVHSKFVEKDNIAYIADDLTFDRDILLRRARLQKLKKGFK